MLMKKKLSKPGIYPEESDPRAETVQDCIGRNEPEEESCDALEMVSKMSHMTNRILIFAVILIPGILAALIYCGIISSHL